MTVRVLIPEASGEQYEHLQIKLGEIDLDDVHNRVAGKYFFDMNVISI